MPTFNGNGLGWTFDVELDDATGVPAKGGLALKNVRHEGHNFARDIRFVGFWVEAEQVDPSGRVLQTRKKFVSQESTSFVVSAVRTLKPQPLTRTYYKSYTHRVGDAVMITKVFDYLKEADAALSFTDYFKSKQNHVAYGVAARSDAKQLFADLGLDNCEQSGLSIEQIFLLSRYGTDPPHEPSGALSAARCHPLVSYELTPNASCDRGKERYRIKSMRFDYRLGLYLDTYLKDKTESGLYNANQAGLFADSDIGSIRATVRVVTLRGVSKIAFYAVEKPLVREVTAPGLIDGASTGRVLDVHGEIVCWDNIHWWGAYAPGQQMISSPGAFHAAHVHWRWGEFLSSLASRAVSAEWRRFQPGIALLDPRIAHQTLFVAITKYRHDRDPNHVALGALSKEKWDLLFHDKSSVPPPEPIKDGGDLVLWYSSEVHMNEDVMPKAGTLFLHGIFFAHEVEQGGSGVGSRGPLYWPRDESDIDRDKHWFRPAND